MVIMARKIFVKRNKYFVYIFICFGVFGFVYGDVHSRNNSGSIKRCEDLETHGENKFIYSKNNSRVLKWLIGIGTTHDLNKMFIFRYTISQLNQKYERKIRNQYTITWTWSI